MGQRKASSFNSLTTASISLSLLLARVAAQGDYACQTTADCAAWSYPNATGGPFPVSANMECVADPLQPQYGYCGYAGAACHDSDDCDYGSCTDSVCVGYLGHGCSSDHDCMGFLHCGTDGFCGGDHAVCASGDPDCMSGSCSYNSRCSEPEEEGQAVGQPCSSDHNCVAGLSCTDYICQDTATASAPAASSAAPSASSALHKRTAPSHGAPYRKHTQMNHVEQAKALLASKAKRGTTSCPEGFTLCPSGLGDSSSEYGFECVDTQNQVDSCGGCLPMPGYTGAATGVDCTVLQNVDQVRCESGSCRIDSCTPGTLLTPDESACA